MIMENKTATAGSTPTQTLSAAGVSIWLDDLSRERVTTGNLAELTRTHEVVGITTNPSIFEASVRGSDAYDAQLQGLGAEGMSADDAVWRLTTDDVRSAADVMRSIYDATDGIDGRVSIEVDPRISRDVDATVALAKTLWATVDRPNIYIKIPGTVEGLAAITQTLAAGVSVNVTLIFSLDRYRGVIAAFLDGLEQAAAAGHDISRLDSVASFFVSRVDTAVDEKLSARDTDVARDLLGRVGIANARLAYQIHEETLASDRWKALAAKGARPQRPLWASTGVKNPDYPDTMYVTELVARGVVNTMPAKTLEAVQDHAVVGENTISSHMAESATVLDRLAALGIDLDEITATLETEGLEKFVKAWEQLVATVAEDMSPTKEDA